MISMDFAYCDFYAFYLGVSITECNKPLFLCIPTAITVGLRTNQASAEDGRRTLRVRLNSMQDKSKSIGTLIYFLTSAENTRLGNSLVPRLLRIPHSHFKVDLLFHWFGLSSLVMMLVSADVVLAF